MPQHDSYVSRGLVRLLFCFHVSVILKVTIIVGIEGERILGLAIISLGSTVTDVVNESENPREDCFG